MVANQLDFALVELSVNLKMPFAFEDTFDPITSSVLQVTVYVEPKEVLASISIFFAVEIGWVRS